MSHPGDLSLNILYLDNHLIAVCKPPGILTQADYSGSESLMDQVKKWNLPVILKNDPITKITKVAWIKLAVISVLPTTL